MVTSVVLTTSPAIWMNDDQTAIRNVGQLMLKFEADANMDFRDHIWPILSFFRKDSEKNEKAWDDRNIHKTVPYKRIQKTFINGIREQQPSRTAFQTTAKEWKFQLKFKYDLSMMPSFGQISMDFFTKDEFQNNIRFSGIGKLGIRDDLTLDPMVDWLNAFFPE